MVENLMGRDAGSCVDSAAFGEHDPTEDFRDFRAASGRAGMAGLVKPLPDVNDFNRVGQSRPLAFFLKPGNQRLLERMPRQVGIQPGSVVGFADIF